MQEQELKHQQTSVHSKYDNSYRSSMVNYPSRVHYFKYTISTINITSATIPSLPL